MNITSSVVAGPLGREETRCSFQDLVRPPQLTILRLQTAHLGGLLRRRDRFRIPGRFRSSHPMPDRLGRPDPQLRRDRDHRFPLRTVIRSRLRDHPRRPLTQLQRIPPRRIRRHNSILPKGQSLRRHRGAGSSYRGELRFGQIREPVRTGSRIAGGSEVTVGLERHRESDDGFGAEALDEPFGPGSCCCCGWLRTPSARGSGACRKYVSPCVVKDFPSCGLGISKSVRRRRKGHSRASPSSSFRLGSTEASPNYVDRHRHSSTRQPPKMPAVPHESLSPPSWTGSSRRSRELPEELQFDDHVELAQTPGDGRRALVTGRPAPKSGARIYVPQKADIRYPESSPATHHPNWRSRALQRGTPRFLPSH
jgi:hypothetical protein